MDLQHRLFLSKAKSDLSKDEVDAILGGSQKGKKEAGVTGILLYRDGYFLELMEGPKQAISDFMKQIENDDKRIDVTTLVDQRAPKRLFANWRIGSIESEKKIQDPASGIQNVLDRSGISDPSEDLIMQTLAYFADADLKAPETK